MKDSRPGDGPAPAVADRPAGRGRARVIWNSSAGQKRPLAPTVTEEQLAELLSRAGLEFELTETRSSAEAAELAAAAVRERRALVVAAGGDGTAATVSSELVGSDTALGILPLGSVMNIARALGIPRELDAAAEVLARGALRAVDVGEADGRLFYEGVSVGMNASIFSAAVDFTEGDYGSLRRLFWLALRYRPARMDLVLDGQTVRTRALMVVVSNGPYTGAGMTVSPQARLDDGLFDVTVFRHFSKLELARHLLAISFGRRRYTPHVRTYRAARVRVESRRSLPVRADGVDLGTTPFECHVRPASLRVIVPGTDPTAAAG